MSSGSSRDAANNKVRRGPASRRQVLKGLSVAGLASVSIPVVGAAQANESAAAPGTPEYRETEHIRRFYELARR